MLLPTLNNERIILASFCCGILDGVLEDALAYMQRAHAFGKKIGQFQILQHYVADIAMWRHQADLVVKHAAWLQDRGDDCFQETTMAKVIASEYAVQGGRPRDSDPRRHGLFGRDRHAALLARRAALPDRPDHQRDGPQRRSPRTSGYRGASDT